MPDRNVRDDQQSARKSDNIYIYIFLIWILVQIFDFNEIRDVNSSIIRQLRSTLNIKFIKMIQPYDDNNNANDDNGSFGENRGIYNKKKTTTPLTVRNKKTFGAQQYRKYGTSRDNNIFNFSPYKIPSNS